MNVLNGVKSGFSSNASKGAFKSSNDLSRSPFGGAGSASGVAGLTKHADQYVMRHSTKGLGFTKSGVMRLKPNLNIGKAIGRKRGY